VVDSVSEVRAAVTAVRKLVDNDLWSGSGRGVLGLVHRLRAQVESMELGLVGEIDSRGILAEVGAVDTRAYLMGALTMSAAEASTAVKPAQAVRAAAAERGWDHHVEVDRLR
jgi:hypothetical protein